MTDEESVRSLDLSFEWALSDPQMEGVPDRVVFDSPVIKALTELEAELVEDNVPETVSLIGQVNELRRGTEECGADGDDSGEIVLVAEAAGRTRNVTVALHGEDYDLAIQAHRRHLPFTVSGVVDKYRNAWWLLEPVTVDRSFLDFHLKGTSSI